jgi:hypothetical protein
MRILNTFSPIALAFALSACVVVPVTDQDDISSAKCQTYTKSMSLKALDLTDNGKGRTTCHDEACLAVALAVFAGSAIISGSIVLTGNTVHWLEYQGTCSDGYLYATKQLFLESVNTPKPAPAS